MVAYKKPQEREREESQRRRGERDQIKFIDRRFERWQVVRSFEPQGSKFQHFVLSIFVVHCLLVPWTNGCYLYINAARIVGPSRAQISIRQHDQGKRKEYLKIHVLRKAWPHIPILLHCVWCAVFHSKLSCLGFYMPIILSKF